MRTPPQILIVDDNPANLDIFETRLAAHGYDIITASDGAAGLAVAVKRKDGRPARQPPRTSATGVDRKDSGSNRPGPTSLRDSQATMRDGLSPTWTIAFFSACIFSGRPHGRIPNTYEHLCALSSFIDLRHFIYQQNNY